MCFDECTPYSHDETMVRRSMELSMRWALRSKEALAQILARYLGLCRVGCFPICAKNRQSFLLIWGFQVTQSVASQWASLKKRWADDKAYYGIFARR